MTSIEDLRLFLELAIKGLVSNQDAVSVTEQSNAKSSACFVISCETSDLAFVFGKGGRNITAIRLVIQAMSSRMGYSVTVMVET